MNKFETIATSVGRLVKEKNEAYGDSFGRAQEILTVLYPNGIHASSHSSVR